MTARRVLAWAALTVWMLAMAAATASGFSWSMSVGSGLPATIR